MFRFRDPWVYRIFESAPAFYIIRSKVSDYEDWLPDNLSPDEKKSKKYTVPFPPHAGFYLVCGGWSKGMISTDDDNRVMMQSTAMYFLTAEDAERHLLRLRSKFGTVREIILLLLILAITLVPIISEIIKE